MFYQGRQPLQAPSQLSPEPRLNQAMRGWPRLNLNDPINRGLVGYWSMDGGTISGTKLTDLSGNGNTGTLTNAPTLVAGFIGQALNLNGSNQYVDFGNPAPLNIVAGGSVTLSVWVNSTNVSSPLYQGLIAKRDDALGTPYAYGISFRGSASELLVYTSGGSSVQVFTYGFSANVWTHVCGVISGGPTALYINGTPIGLLGGGGGVASNTANLTAGRSSNSGEYLSGSIDDVSVYNRALSAAEIQRIYFDTSGNLRLIAPPQKIVASTAAPSSTPYFPVFLGGAGLIAMRAARMFRQNKAPTRRQFLALSDRASG